MRERASRKFKEFFATIQGKEKGFNGFIILENKEQFNKENAAVQQLIGQDISGIHNPQIRKKFVGMAIEAERGRRKLPSQFATELNLQKNHFTEPSIEEENSDEIRAEEEPFNQEYAYRVEQPKLNKSAQFNDIPEYQLDAGGRTGKDLYAFEKDLRADNEPIRKESAVNKRTVEKSLRSLGDLKKLSKKIPSGISRLFFNAEGNIRPLAQVLQLVPPEAEEYVKIVNDFTTQAKDSYGARVTNFELDRFLKRLPTAINSEKGRDLIISRMQNIAEIDLLREQALQDVYRKYGLGKITPEDAESIADQVAESRTAKLIEEGNILDGQLEQFDGVRKESQRPSLEEIFG